MGDVIAHTLALLKLAIGKKVRAYGILSLAKTLALANLAKSDDRRTIVYVGTDAQMVHEELGFFAPHVHTKVFAEYETLVYDALPIHSDIISARLGTLSDMPQVLLTTPRALLARIAPKSYVWGKHFDLKVGARFDIERTRNQLIGAGYRAVDTVYQAGEFCVRGAVVDIFAMGQDKPMRLDLFDDIIESIRFFEPSTQRTQGGRIKQVQILPAKEFDLTDSHTFAINFASLVRTHAKKSPIYQEVMAGIASAGLEYYLPLFFDQDEFYQDGHLFAYLERALIVFDETHVPMQTQFLECLAHARKRFEMLAHDIDNPILPPERLFLSIDEINAHLQNHALLAFGAPKDKDEVPFMPLPDVHIEPKAHTPLQKLHALAQDKKVLLAVASAGRREILQDLLQNQAVNVADFADFLAQSSAGLYIAIAPFSRGLMCKDWAIVDEGALFGKTHAPKTTHKRTSEALLIKSIAEIGVGDLVVHIEHGIGRYLGLSVLDLGQGEQEFIHLQYQDDASIYVPLHHLALISRLGTQGEIGKIGSGKWERARQKAAESAHDVAAELLAIESARHAKSGISFNIDSEYALFASSFGFEETIDQAAAIHAVLDDMRMPRPMDRLVCGDVGFGKTEVAMRAAFVAVQNGYQVAVLVPTTLLASQHYDSFVNRFADWPVRVESLSRFGTPKHKKSVLDGLQSGNVDIVIGTHKILQGDVKFANLGLMIVDEEHRFGVRDKAKIKAMQADIDCLSMTATPIPRTLNMALSGMQDLSIIATPPARRLPIKTFLVRHSNAVIIDAIMREVLRGGQVYFLYNDVASIERMAQNLRELLPEVSCAVAHGQMGERELSAVMVDFYHKKYQVLLASTIIETGIDVPNANTILIYRADKFGLSQLHQLRGRVGRAHHQAYCYLLVPEPKSLRADAKRRLEAICHADALGAGFVLASEDLEIRGAGELLGKAQSGQMQTVGASLYMQMLKRATQAIKSGKVAKMVTPSDLVSDINLHRPALIGDAYVADVHERLMLYQRLDEAQSDSDLQELKREMIDRFGALPESVGNLLALHRVRIAARTLGIGKIEVREDVFSMQFLPEADIDFGKVLQLVQSGAGFNMAGAQGISYQVGHKAPKNAVLDLAHLDALEALFSLLAWLS